MSDFHVLKQAEDKKTIDVVFHIPIPTTLNTAGVTWQQAIVKELGGSNAITSRLPDIALEEETALKAGQLYEWVGNIRFSSTVNITNADRLAQIKAKYVGVKALILAEKQIVLDFIGYSGNII